MSSAPIRAGGERLGALETLLERHFGRVLLVAFLLALLVRALALAEIASSPAAAQHRWSETDMHFFDRWARAIADGDVLSASVGHPHLGWHDAIAQRYLAEDPALREELSRGGDRAERALWERWYGGPQFHQEPLYAYLVGATYALAGPRPIAVFAWQIVLGALSVVLVASLARRAFGALAGTVSAFLAALCAPLVFHELVLLRTTTIVFLSMLLPWLALRAGERPSWRRAASFGLASGLALLANSTFAPLVLGLAAITAWRMRRTATGAGRVVPAAAFAVALFATLVPAWIRNASVGAPLFSTSSVGALAFVCSNAADFEPRVGFATDSVHLTRILRESDNELLRAIPATLRTHASPAAWLAQVGKKLDWAWRWYEIPNNENFYAYRRWSAVLRALPITFLGLAPLALVGLALAWRRREWALELYLVAACALLPLIAFYVLSRFRAPLLIACIPFAALTLVELARAIADRRASRAGSIAAAACACAFWTARPLPADMPTIRPSDWTAPFLAYYAPEAEAAARAGEWERAARILERGLADEPDFVRELAPGASADGFDQAALEWIDFAAQLRERAASALRRAGRVEEALPHERRAAELRAIGAARR